ncbi:hypothetical protein SDC9_202455 [bioreactor metagenome]|uniref:Uncharacterized protein n=1 Tax=bioreactor metagenome TaxID=1076179 RepID=A0A645ITP6_9ZZZZ
MNRNDNGQNHYGKERLFQWEIKPCKAVAHEPAHKSLQKR